jgi:hypothetical protein
MTALLPKHTLEIDEEGFPLTNGMRIEDGEILAELVPGIKRLFPGQVKGPLVSTFGGAPVLIDAFDEPLVAQRVDRVTEASSLWIFLGEREQKVAHKDLYLDPWHRLHAFIGEEKIPAVLSRKAQGAFLNAAPVESLLPRPYWADENEKLSSLFWTQAYTQKQDGWELGTATPVLTHFKAPPWLAAGAKILVPGAGRGHDAVFLESLGFAVTALDSSPEAHKNFEKLYPESKLSFVEDDFFSFAQKNTGHFDAVFEHTILCAISPSRRFEYIGAIENLLKAEGTYFGVFFREMWLGGPPYGMTQWQLRALTQEKFRYRKWEMSLHSPKNRQGLEIFAVMQKH